MYFFDIFFFIFPNLLEIRKKSPEIAAKSIFHIPEVSIVYIPSGAFVIQHQLNNVPKWQ